MLLAALTAAAGLLLSAVHASPVLRDDSLNTNAIVALQFEDHDFQVKCYVPKYNLSRSEMNKLAKSLRGLRSLSTWHLHADSNTAIAEGGGVYIIGELMDP